MRGTAWGLLAATGITVVLSLTKEVTPCNRLPGISCKMHPPCTGKSQQRLQAYVEEVAVQADHLSICIALTVAPDDRYARRRPHR